MQIEIIPAIIAKDFDELKKKIEKVEQYVKWVQLDIMDGDFVPNSTWNNPEDLKYYDPGVLLEAHLMISEPEKYVEQWIDAGAKRIIFHVEATSSPYAIEKLCHKKDIEVGVAINPETDLSAIEALSKVVDLVLVLGVTPGFSGQEFKSEVLEKIKALREANPHLTIEVDGGMNPKTASEAIHAGANAIAAGSYILKSNDVRKAVDELKNVNSHSS